MLTSLINWEMTLVTTDLSQGRPPISFDVKWNKALRDKNKSCSIMLYCCTSVCQSFTCYTETMYKIFWKIWAWRIGWSVLLFLTAILINSLSILSTIYIFFYWAAAALVWLSVHHWSAAQTLLLLANCWPDKHCSMSLLILPLKSQQRLTKVVVFFDKLYHGILIYCW